MAETWLKPANSSRWSSRARHRHQDRRGCRWRGGQLTDERRAGAASSVVVLCVSKVCRWVEASLPKPTAGGRAMGAGKGTGVLLRRRHRALPAHATRMSAIADVLEQVGKVQTSWARESLRALLCTEARSKLRTMRAVALTQDERRARAISMRCLCRGTPDSTGRVSGPADERACCVKASTQSYLYITRDP